MRTGNVKKIIEIAPFTQSNERANCLFPAAAHPGENLGSALRTHGYITPSSLQKIITNLVTETSAHLSP